MSDIGLNPPGTRHDRVEGGVATVSGLKYGDVVCEDVAATGQNRAVCATTTPGAGPIRGVVVSQCDPTSGCAVGDNLEICTAGIPEVNLAASNAITKGDELTTSATSGAAKKLGSEVLPWILGKARQDMASNASVVRIAVELNIRKNPYPTS